MYAEEYDDYDGMEGQGADDAMIDPMQFVQSALNYGRKQYGIPGDGDQQEMGFEDGGVVPMSPDPEVTGGGNPNAVNPQQAMAYLTGDGAVSSEIAQAFEQRIDPQREMNPTQRAMAAIGVAPTDEARFGLLQHYRTKYNAYSGAAKAALSKGDMGGAAHYATMAMDSVPDGKRTQFAPAQGGVAMMSKPAFGATPQPQQQSFEDGGEVEEDDEAQDYTLPELPPAEQPPVQELQQEAPVQEYAPEPVVDSQRTMPAQSTPEVIPAQALAKMLSEGFDAKLKGPAAPSFAELQQRQRPLADAGSYPSEYDNAAPKPEEPSPFDSRRWLKGAASLFGSNEPPAPTTGSEASTRTDGEVVPTVSAPVTRPASRQPQAAEGAIVDDERVNPFTGQVRPKVQGTFGSRQEAGRSGGVVPTGDEAVQERRGPARTRDDSPQRVVRGTLGTNETSALPPPRNNDTEAQRNQRQNAKYRDFMSSIQSADVHSPGGDGVFTTKAPMRLPDEDEHQARMRRIEADASTMHPWVGRDAGARSKFVDDATKRYDERQKAFGVEEYKADRAEGAEQGKEKRASDRAASAERIAEGNRQAKLEASMLKNRVDLITRGNSEAGKLLKTIAAAQPGIAADPFALRRAVAPHLEQLGIRGTQKEMEDLGAILRGADPSAGLSTSPRQPQGSSADSSASSFLEGRQPGDRIPLRGKDGKEVIRIIGPDGKGYSERAYQERFGGR